MPGYMVKVWGVRLSGAMQARSSSDPMVQQLARMTLAGLPRGGGDGDAIRHGILNVMRENGIREGHRPVSPLPTHAMTQADTLPYHAFLAVAQPWSFQLLIGSGQ